MINIDPTVSVGNLIVLVMAGFGAVGAWYRLRSTSQQNAGKAEAAQKSADDANAKAQHVERALAEHKLHVAERYATKEGLNEFRDEMRQGFRDITVRLDHVIQADHKPVRRS